MMERDLFRRLGRRRSLKETWWRVEDGEVERVSKLRGRAERLRSLGLIYLGVQHPCREWTISL